jgi:hypothetical protein
MEDTMVPHTPDPIADLEATLPPELLDELHGHEVLEAGFGAGPGCVAGKIERFEPPVPLARGLAWIARWSGVLRKAHLQLDDGSVLWFEPGRFVRWDRAPQRPPRPGLVVHHPPEDPAGGEGP